MKKLLTTLAFLLALVSLTVTAKEKTIITFAAMKTFGTDTMTKLIDEFEKQNPDIEVKYIKLPSPNNSTEIHQYLVVNLGAKSQDLDVFTADCIWFPEFAQAGWLLDLEKYFTNAERNEYFKGAIETVTYKDKLVGVPWYMDGALLYYRKDLLDKYGFKPPKYWKELTEQAQTILEKEKNSKLNGFVWQGKQAEVLVCNLVDFLGSKGVILNEAGKPVINNEYGLKTAQLMHDFLYKSKISPKSIITYDEEPSRTVFTDGRAIFLMNWTYVWDVAQDKELSKVAGNVGIVPVPAFEGAEGASCLGGYQFGINSATTKKEASVKFVKFLSNYENQKYFALKINFAPTRIAVYNDKEFKKEKPFMAELQDVFIHSKPRPLVPNYPEISMLIQSSFSTLLANLQTPKQTVDSLNQQLEFSLH